ncbi:hypothetical protein CEUSTIGMA_g6911.t1 [Chlamydomonas eustigma]|uniref:Uncharacterized protein n=1 Tax=Chlamydomonas eustigma TaxID=1157962 RepID=A0A250X9M1_9CHLO|nr:hypothetical protein CEUSTIGMA_g6911.t1 [Chlamydomonas eustigma]|eukprot:GAX79470.1 hypothetical protein CEUSTIGMA_g6911.t1 [Chlamydomonas eustigma]
MGLDGGTIITRSDVLRGQSWQVNQRDGSRSSRGGSVSTAPSSSHTDEKLAERVSSWTSCSMSGQPLQEPVVADKLGRLFNKNAVVEYLLAKKHDIFVDGERSVHQLANNLRVNPNAYSHIKKLKDVFPVYLSSPSSKMGEGSGSMNEAASSTAICAGSFNYCPYYCPVTSLSCLKYSFTALTSCGHVMSDRALAGVRAEALECPVCGSAYQKDKVVPINGNQDQVDALRQRLPSEEIQSKDEEKPKSLDKKKRTFDKT